VTAVDIGSLIVRSPELRGNRPLIAGTGVTVRTIALCHKSRLSPEEIRDEFPHLTFAQVYAALAYFHANRDEVEQDIAQEEAEGDEIERQHFERLRRGT
jgi:uncharacterized protein (DUF433 family)